MPATTRKPRQEARAVYASITFRPTPLIDRRLKRLSAATGQPVSALVKECIAAHLSVLEGASKEAA